jgi:hypothetical protein
MPRSRSTTSIPSRAAAYAEGTPSSELSHPKESDTTCEAIGQRRSGPRGG